MAGKRYSRFSVFGTQDAGGWRRPLDLWDVNSGREALHPHGSARSGQAMIELVVGLVAVLVLFAGLLQIVSLTQTQTDVLVAARREAGQRGMAGTANRMTPDYILNWEEGPDASRYSVDDIHTAANPSRFRSAVIEQLVADPSEWTVVDAVPDTPFSDLHANANPISNFGLLKGSDARTVDLIPTIRDLVYSADSITVESEVWMPWMRGLY